jgi:cyclopropane fatty-acyl-phospholipid synthase-like methyltransferase
MMRFLRALIVLHRTYRSRPANVRLHALVRFLTCPFLRVLPAMPADARSMLEIGAGHGVFSRLAADRQIRRAVAVEPDLRKLARVDAVRFVAGFDDVVRGTFDVVALIDVLYTIPIAHWDALLTRAYDRLGAGGMLIVKEQDPAAGLKNAWNRAQEWFAQKVLRVTIAHAFSYESRETFAARLERHGFTGVASRRIDRGYPHPHVLYVARRERLS